MATERYLWTQAQKEEARLLVALILESGPGKYRLSETLQRQFGTDFGDLQWFLTQATTRSRFHPVKTLYELSDERARIFGAFSGQTLGQRFHSRSVERWARRLLSPVVFEEVFESALSDLETRIANAVAEGGDAVHSVARRGWWRLWRLLAARCFIEIHEHVFGTETTKPEPTKGAKHE